MELTNEIEGKKGVNCLLFSDSFGSSSSLSDGLKQKKLIKACIDTQSRIS